MTPDSERTARVAALLVRHRTEAYAYLLAALGDPHEADDVLQEVSLTAIRIAERYQEDRNFRAWIREIIRFTLLERAREARRGTTPVTPEFLDSLARAADEFEQGDNADARRLALRECLRTLTGLARRVVALRYEEGLGVAEIARQLGRNVLSTYTVLKRARTALRACVERKIAGGMA